MSKRDLMIYYKYGGFRTDEHQEHIRRAYKQGYTLKTTSYGLTLVLEVERYINAHQKAFA